MSTTVGELREQAAPWLHRGTPAPLERTVDTTDRADWAVWDQVAHECTALASLDADVTEQHGTPGLVRDLWMAAYARDPQLRDAADTVASQRSNRAVVAAMLDTPEHHELRAATVGDPYMAAMSVLAQAPALRRMLRELDPRGQQTQAEQAHREAEDAAERVAEAFQDAQDAAAEDAGLPDDGAGAGGDQADSEQQADHEQAKNTGEHDGQGDGSDDTEESDTDESDTDESDADAGQDGEGEPDGPNDSDSPDGLEDEAAEQAEDEDPASDGPAGAGDDDAGTELDALPVPRPDLVDVQRAISDAMAADADAVRAEQAAARLGEGDERGEQAMMLVRSTARQACADAAEALEAEATAMTAWGVEPGERERLDPDARMKLAEKLQTGKLKEFAKLVGRFQQMAQAQRSRRVEHTRGEYVGVELGDDLTSLLPAELVNLALPALRAQFAVRYAEQQLMVYDQRGEEHEGQGAIIVCVDCSGSMITTDEHGVTGEAYAKAFALALLEQARNAKPVREFACFLFSATTDAAIVFPADQPVKLADRIRLAEEFTGGGTEFTPPLNAALKLIDDEYNRTGRQRADIVFVTDGDAHLPTYWLDHWRKQKNKLGFRCFGIQIGRWAAFRGLAVLEKFCDDTRRIEDLTDTHATADLFRAV